MANVVTAVLFVLLMVLSGIEVYLILRMVDPRREREWLESVMDGKERW